MHVLTVAYGHPTDPSAFDAHYTSTHRPLAEQVPRLQSFEVRHCSSLDDAPPPFYCIAQLGFTSADALTEALQSEAGRAAAADIANFADGGAQIFVQQDR